MPGWQFAWSRIWRRSCRAALVGVLVAVSSCCLVARTAAARYTVETAYLTIILNDQVDLAGLEKSIDFGGISAGLFSSSTPQETEKRLIRKMDALYEKVQRILDMRKAMSNKVRVHVHAGAADLDATFRKIFHKSGSVRSWYVYEYNTVYVNAEDLHEGMLAHELAHAIIDHYLSVRPPRATAEILATYVDNHLFEEVKSY